MRFLMRMRRLSIPGLSIFTYLLIDQKAGCCAVIDPVRDIGPLLQLVEQEELRITDVLETHVHADFLSGAKELKHHLGDAVTIHCSGMGGKAWIPKYADRVLKDREEVIVGTVRIQAWHTPGHSPEHLTYVIFDDSRDKEHPCAALTGDFLFVGSLGRPDLLGNEALETLSQQLYHSVTKVLPELPDYLEIFPAHGAGSFCGKGIGSMSSSTVGYERQANPLLHAAGEKIWTDKLLEKAPKTPRYFEHMKRLNVTGPPLLEDLAPPRLMQIQELLSLDRQEVQIVDVRSVEEFSAGFLPGAVNIPPSSSFAMWATEFILPEVPIALVAPDEETAKSTLSILHLIGLDHIMGYCIFTPAQVKLSKKQLFTISLAAPEFVAGYDSCILDVRTAAEWESGHIADAIHIELTALPAQLPPIPKDQALYVICGMGQRASTAVSLLRRAGFDKANNIRGGMQAWSQAKLPIES